MDAAPVEVRADAPAPTQRVSPEEAERAMRVLQGAMPTTRFVSAWPSAMPGLVALRLANGQVAYTDKTGRYFVVGLIFDSNTGAALDKQMDGTP